ncbi:hypothetical protein FTO68_06915 [Methanocalculus taiwanensis]|uniref:Single Cache domain-containing protein n=1 Tax=Methanocalculus taiwanensis TaxID=106207 RepID=A0ABD4TLR0_9EURY|nr:cache domain-containing protein [Methanocalculus taiwanensis]MCQ1538713.1 hypothetical protein [Methanocalculus taiwanensis]
MRQNIYSTFLCLLLLIAASGCISASEPRQPDVTQKEMVAFVQIAFEYADMYGKEAALLAFNDPNGPFVKGELYIFAYEEDGTTLALPFEPDQIGSSRSDLQDAEGRYIIREIIETGLEGGGFVRYLYANPTHGFAVEPKISYVMKGGDGWVLGSGLYSTDETMMPDSEVTVALADFVDYSALYTEAAGRKEALVTLVAMQALLSRYHEETEAQLTSLDNEMLLAGAHISAVGLADPSTHKVLAYVTGTSEVIFDVVSFDAEGRITDVYPETYASAIGADISAQPHIRVILDEKKPVISQLLHTLEGQDGVSLAYPVVSADGRITGGISALVLPPVLIGGAADAAGIRSPYSARAIQADGTVLYAEDPEEIGLMIFSDPGYEIFPDVGRFRSRIESDPEGDMIIGLSGVKKHVVWDTVSLHGTDWRLVVVKEF